MAEVRRATPGSFEEVLPLLLRFGNTRMQREDWRRMLFDLPWRPEEEHRGFTLHDGAKTVGFLGTLFSAREIRGRRERFCHLSCWIVDEAYRSESMKLVFPVLSMRSHTVVNDSPSPTAHEIFSSLGYRPFEDRRLLLPQPSPRALLGSFGAEVTSDPDEVRAGLTGESARLFDEHRGCKAAMSLLVRKGARRSWVLATTVRRRGVPMASVQHASDWDVFWEHLALVEWAFLRLGRVGLAVDGRFAEGRRPLCLVRPLTEPRLYRPAHPGMAPRDVDGLHSEMVGLAL